MRLKLPRNSYTGMKIYCNQCKKDNANCSHFEKQVFRIRIHVTGTKNKIISRKLNSKKYEGALKEALNLKEAIVKSNFQSIKITDGGNDYSIVDAVLKYYQYLDGKHKYSHKQKNVSEGHRDECIRHCGFFVDTLKSSKNVATMRVVNTTQGDVARFYDWATEKYSDSTFNKCFRNLKAFYKFLIDIEEIDMKNPFEIYVPKLVSKNKIQTLSKKEFNDILNAVDTCDPIHILGGKGERKNKYQPYLKDAFKLFLLTGGRNEEVVNLRWSDILITMNNIKFFEVENHKTKRQNISKNRVKSVAPKYFPINSDLFELLMNLGYEEKKNTDDFILCPNRTEKFETIISNVSKGFTHYRIGAGIKKDVSLRNLRKTYLSWVQVVMNKDTRILSSHTSDEVLEKHYLDPTIISAIEKAALEIQIFGT